MTKIFLLILGLLTFSIQVEASNGRCSHSSSEDACNTSSVGDSCRRTTNRGICTANEKRSDGYSCTCLLDPETPKAGVSDNGSLPCEGENVFGKYPKDGGCNPYGCYPPNGSCNPFGCSLVGECDAMKCPRKIKTYKCYELN